MSIIDQIYNSTLGLERNNIPEPQRNSPAWGYVGPDKSLDPSVSRLHNEYSTFENPRVDIIGFNKEYSNLKLPSNLDVLDPIAPKLNITGVVSQTYSPAPGDAYRSKGPREGRY
jgi:hypothetical protein